MPERSRTPRRPRDPNQLAKLVVDIATGEGAEAAPKQKNPAAVELGRKGGLKGGQARAEKLSAEDRRLIAARAAQARWSRPRGS